MTSLQNHLRQLSGNKQNKKSRLQRGRLFLFLFLVLQEITYFHEKFFFIAWLRSQAMKKNFSWKYVIS